MPLETLDRTPPPFFKQGPSALSRLLFFSALALFFMVADGRFHVMQPLRASISVALYSAQWLTLQPVRWARSAGDYFTNLSDARKDEADARALLIEQARRSGQVEALQAENQRLRALLNLRQRVNATKTTTAEALYDATDPYTRQVVIDKGQAQGIQAGSPVIDETGVIGQVTRVYPFVSEVTLLVDRNQTIPVLNPRTGLRSITYGDP
ncbi:MAG: rod shape-determining protein MreC, partial [Burkholderiaceae bacterium]|nr:rod shape-determining protein MreC [Burkholderiaceae bacterium]